MIVQFVVYIASGEILRSGSCPQYDVTNQIMAPGEMVCTTEGYFDPQQSMVVDGVVVPKVPPQ